MDFRQRLILMLIFFKTFFVFNDASRSVGFDESYSVNWGNRHVLLVNQGRELSLDRSPGFDENYSINWGNHHVLLVNQGKEAQLSLDPSSGAGFKSKADFASGYFQMKIKLPGKDSAGVVTAFYLNSSLSVHDELDFEFLGNRPGKPITLQTNVFTNGVGGREQKSTLWFDPTADFHYYKLLWNEHHIVFFVDDTPIRVFNNNIKKGVGYPIGTMQVVVSLWDGSDWATDGGKSKANYSNGPLQAHFQDFKIDGCPSPKGKPNKDCYSTKYWWNCKDYLQLSPNQLKAYEDSKKKYMSYDYCTDKGRYPTPPPECVG